MWLSGNSLSLLSSWPHLMGLKVWELESPEGHSHVYWLMLGGLKAGNSWAPWGALHLPCDLSMWPPSRTTHRCPANSHTLGDLNSMFFSLSLSLHGLTWFSARGLPRLQLKCWLRHSHLETQLGENMLFSSFGKFPGGP